MPEKLVRALRLIGTLLSILGVAFLVWAIVSLRAVDALLDIPIAHALGAVLAYAAASVLLALAWISLLPNRTGLAGRSVLFWVYARSVMAKYLPGNVFQFASRQIDLARYGYSQKEIAKASVREIAGLVLASLGVMLSLFALTGSYQRMPLPHIVQSHAQALLAAAGLAWVFTVLWTTRTGLLRARALGLQFVFFLAFETVGMVILAAVFPLSPSLPPAGVFCLAWLIGFVVIGAPAGLGVREMVFIAMLSGHVPMQALVGVAAALRATTILGDGLFAAAAWIYARVVSATAPSAQDSD